MNTPTMASVFQQLAGIGDVQCIVQPQRRGAEDENGISKRQREVLSPALENLKRSGRIKVTSHEDGSEWYEIIR